MRLPFHPFADIFQLLGEPDFSALAEDIRAHGLREEIVVFDGKILDGRNRYLAALKAGLLTEDDTPDDRPIFFKRFSPTIDGDPLAFVISKNIHRRHLTVGQRAYAMAQFETFRHGGDRKSDQDANLRLDQPTRADLAERAHVSERSITNAATVRDHGTDELKDAVKQGNVAISTAAEIARLPKEEQRRAINGARSVMASRAEPDDSLDYFPTPPWATRALFKHVLPEIGADPEFFNAAWEPACGEGHIAEVLEEHFQVVAVSDIFDYGYHEQRVIDFLKSDEKPGVGCDWIITNPPFGDNAEAFVLRALQQADIGVAMFFRLQWLETVGRFERIFRPYPPAIIAQFAERVPLHKGRWEPDGSTATAYLWIVWQKTETPFRTQTRFFWIPPGCKDALTRPDDRARFTAHPVIHLGRFERLDPATGEISDSVDGGGEARDQEGAANAAIPEHSSCAPLVTVAPGSDVPEEGHASTGMDALTPSEGPGTAGQPDEGDNGETPPLVGSDSGESEGFLSRFKKLVGLHPDAQVKPAQPDDFEPPVFLKRDQKRAAA